MAWNSLSGRGKRAMPAPLPANESQVQVQRPVGKVDGRSARKTGRDVQFNPRVRSEWLEEFKALMAEEEARAGVRVTQAYMLELLAHHWRASKGKKGEPFGLSASGAAAARKLAELTGGDISAVLDDVLARRLKELGLHGAKPEKSKA